jgi:hypothetical protein
MKKLLVASMLVCSVALGQESGPMKVVSYLTDYLLQNGSVGTGYGTEWGMKSDQRGPTINYALETPLGLRLWKLETKLALGYNTTFSDDVNRQHLFIAVPVYYFSLPPWVGDVVNAPKRTLAEGPAPISSAALAIPDFAWWTVQPAIGMRPEDIGNMAFNYKRIFLGVQYQVRFN